MRATIWTAVAALILLTAACTPGTSGASPTAAESSTTGTPGATASAAGPDWPVPPDGAPVALFLGDSYTAGTALPVNDLPQRWSTVVAAEQGWREVNAGCNGSGFVRVGPVCEYNYPDRVASLADTDPAVVIVLGGINDRGSDEAEVLANVRRTFERLREEFPEARMYAATAFTYTPTAHPRLAQINEELRRLADEFDYTVIELGEPLLAEPGLLAPDGLHPSIAGHAAIADAITAGLDAHSPG